MNRKDRDREMTPVDMLQELHRLCAAPAYPNQDYVLSRYTYRDIHDMAAGIKGTFADIESKTVCLCTEDKGIIAACILAALDSDIDIVLPYSFSSRALKEMREATGFSRAIADAPVKLPSGVEAISVIPADSEKRPLSFTRSPDSIFLTLFTGGSTGKPVYWKKTPKNMFSEALYLSRKIKASNSDRFLATVVPYHIYGLLFSVLTPLVSNAIVIPEVSSFPQEIVSALEKHQATVLVSVPIHYRILKETEISTHMLRLAVSSSGPLDESDAESFIRRTGVDIIEIYGSTETGGVASRNSAKGETSFYPFEIVDWKIEDERLFVRSDFISVQLTTDPDGYFKVGDRVIPYDDKSFLMVGRVDGIIKIAGKRVDLKDIQHRLKKGPGVRDALVISRPTGTSRENEIMAVIEGETDEVTIKRYATQMLEPYAVPRIIKVIDKMPVTPAGKYDGKAIEKILKSDGA